MDPIERVAREHLALGRFRKARDDFKILCKKDRPRYLPLLIEANVGLARQMIDTGLFENASQVIEHLRAIAPASVVADLELRQAAKGGACPTSLPALELLSQPPSALPPEVRTRWLDDLVLTFQPVVARTSTEASIAADVNAVQAALATLSAGDFDAAHRLTASIARDSPASHWRLFIKGLIAVHSQDPAKAVAAFDRLPPNSVPALASEAYRALVGPKESLNKSNFNEPLIGALCTLIGHPEIAPALTCAEAAWRKNDWLGSYDALRQGIRDFPSRKTDLRGILSEFFFKSFQRQPQRSVERGIDQFWEMLDRRKTKNQAEETWLSWLLPLICADDFEPKYVEAKWCRFIELEMASPGFGPTRQSKAWTWVGKLMSKKRSTGYSWQPKQPYDADRAISAFAKAAALDPTNVEPSLLQCDLYETIGRNSDRNRLLDRMVKQFPKEKGVVIRAGKGCLDRKALTKAAGYFDIALQLDPLDHKIADQLVDCRIQIAAEQFKNGKVEAGRKSLSQNKPLLTLQPGNFIRTLWHHEVHRAVLEILLGNPSDGDKLLTEISPQSPGTAVLWFFVHLARCRFDPKGSRKFAPCGAWHDADLSSFQGPDLLLCLKKMDTDRKLRTGNGNSGEIHWLQRFSRQIASKTINPAVARDLVELMEIDVRLHASALEIIRKQDPNDLFFKLLSYRLNPPPPRSPNFAYQQPFYQALAQQASALGDSRTAQVAHKFLNDPREPRPYGDFGPSEIEDDLFDPFEGAPMPNASKNLEHAALDIMDDLDVLTDMVGHISPEELRRNSPPGIPKEFIEMIINEIQRRKQGS